MFDTNFVAFVALGTVLAGLAVAELKKYIDYRVKLSAIPTYGRDGLLSSYVSGWEFVKHGTRVVQEGYKKYPNQAFKVAMLDRYLVVVTGKNMIDDLRKAGDDELSGRDAFRETLYTDYTFGPTLLEHPFHIEAIQGALTRHLASMFGEVYDELSRAFDDEIPLTDEWVRIPTLVKVQNIVCRTSNRLFVGLPLCRNKEWQALNIRHTIDVFIATTKASLFPRFMQSLVAWYTSPYNASLKTALKHLEPVIRERVEKFKAGEELEEDMLTWIIQAAPKDEPDKWLTPEELASRLLSVNLAAIHTTSQATTHALINLVLHPDFIEPLRKEIESCIEKDGWSKAAMGKMRKLDSFLKESQRVSSSGAISIRRLALKDFIFSDGTVIPAGTMVSTSPSALHFDEEQYSNPFEFDGLRSYKKREQEGESLKHQMVIPETNYVAFGAGKHACPGRFFAVSEIKAIVSHLLLNYDIKLDSSGAAPKTKEISGRIQTNSKTMVMLRRRQTKV